MYQCLREAAGAAEEAAHARDTLVAHEADLEAAVHQLQVCADAVMGLQRKMTCNPGPSHASSNPHHAVCSHAALQASHSGAQSLSSQAFEHSCSQSNSQIVRLDLQARLDNQAAAVDAAKGHQAQIQEAQGAADELVTHAQQAQREALREAASWQAQVRSAAQCTDAAAWWCNQTRRVLLPADRTIARAPVVATLWKAAASL